VGLVLPSGCLSGELHASFRHRCGATAILRPGLGGRDRNMGPVFGLGPGLAQELIDTKQLDTQAVQRLSRYTTSRQTVRCGLRACLSDDSQGSL
jgi:hypothetical protein